MAKKGLTFSVRKGGYVYGYYSASDGKVQETLSIKVSKEDWDIGMVPAEVSNKLNHYKYLVDTYIGKCLKADTIPTKAEIEAIIQKERDGEAKVVDDTLGKLFTDYLLLLRKGEITNDGKAYGPSTLLQHQGVAKHLRLSGLDKVKVNAFTVKHLNAFIAHLHSFRIGKTRKITKNTVSIYVLYLMLFFKRTYKKPYKWHTNTIHEEDGTTVSPEDVDSGVAMNDEDMIKWKAVEVNDDSEQQAKDLFIFGANVGLRYSDLFALQGAAGKNNRLELNTGKTTETLYIPMNSEAQHIWNKYKGKIPRIAYEDFLATIKRLGERAKIDESCLFSRTEGGKRIREYRPKYTMLGTHAMRRTFATNAFKSKVPTKLIMRITGHKDEPTFYRYIRITSLESADIMSEYEFFK